MIITCKECSTSFNLDDSLVKESGSKCRCSVCKHIFTAYPVPVEQAQETEESSDLILESDVSDFEIEEDDFSIEEDSDLDMEPSELEMDDDGVEFDSPEFEVDESKADSEDSDFDMGDDFSFEDSDFAMDDDISEEPGEDDILAFEDDGLEFEVEEDEDDSDDITSGPVGDEADIEDHESVPVAEKRESALKMEDKNNEEVDDTLIEDDDEFSEYDEVLEQETEPEDEDSFDEKNIQMDSSEEKNAMMPREEEKSVLTPAPGSSRRQKKSGIGMPVLLLLLVFLLVAGAYIASVMTEYKIPYISDVQIPFIEQYLKKPSNEISDIRPLPNQKSVNGRFVTNTTAGILFVITGRVDNPSDTACRYIQIQGTLITKGKKEAKTKNAYCGNIISEDMLKTGNIADINKIISVKTGNNNLNSNIKPKASIPFMIVFSDLPDKLQNFTVKITGFERVDSR